MKKVLALCALLGGISLVGCGGGGGGSSSLTSSGSGRAAVLLTDGFREDFSHVWATIYHVELVPQAGTNNGANVVLYDNSAGVQIDLKTLRDSTGGRFSFLGSATIPAGTYTAITVTVGPTMQLFQNGAAVGSPLTVDTTLPKDANGNPILTDTFKTPKTLGSAINNLIVDFNLAHFIVRGSKILPVVEDGDPAGVGDPGRHNPDEYHGTVSNLTGTSPTLTFTLTQKNGNPVIVATTASTSLFGATTLANGSVVEVTGTLDTTTQNLVATQLEVEPANTPEPGPGSQKTQRASGTASALDATAGTFTLTVNSARGFTPSATTVNIVINTSTMLRGDNGATLAQADFFTALGTTPTAAVQGTYDATSNTLTATGAMVVNHANDGGWEHDQHHFRPGTDAGNWGHGVFHDGGH